MPELGPEWFEQARPAQERHPEIVANPPRGRGRPPSEDPKVAVSIRLDREIIEHFKAGGSGWQTRINMVLRRAMRRSGWRD
ncbi:MAG: BrnA antitoxin family protein [Azospirillaceae bacterium]